MGKSDDSRQRRKNKLKTRKQNDANQVSTRVAAIIAAKKRRKTGKRTMCQGMCYSLPTPEDPFNDRYAKEETDKIKEKKQKPRKDDRGKVINSNKEAQKKTTNALHERKGKYLNVDEEKMIDDMQQDGDINVTKIRAHLAGKSGKNGQPFEILECPSKFLILCLNSIQNALRHECASFTDVDKPLFVDTWGVEFWKCFSLGKDMVDVSGACSTTEQIAWITSTAADTIARKEKEGLSIPIPFLLFLVASKEKASMVRSVCKPLKALGIHSVSLHAGASLDHQIQGLKSCEPEFLVSTPERLLELLSLNAVDIAGISLLVVDEGIQPEIIKSVRKHIHGTPQTLIFNNCLDNESSPAVDSLLPQTVCRLGVKDAVKASASCNL
ncbi:uncharacterized protein LOC108200296 [Daucus carota subsp. sativus]|nr:PREDICTED: probable ATP-dependent RNA helicase ddx5 [Daucus carota subsp. sativus]